MDANKFNAIVVVDSIPPSELNTAKRLHEDIASHAVAYPPAPLIEFRRVESGREFVKYLGELTSRVSTDGILPLLHIECHGCWDGFSFADKSSLNWEALKQPVTDLNVATRLNLMMVVAACTGGALAKTVQMVDRAPFWGMIGPTKELFPEQLEKPYRAFYTTLLSTRSPAQAIAALDAASDPGLYWRTTSQGLFEKGWAGYKREYCTPEVLESRAQRMHETAVHRAIQPLPSVAELKDRIVRSEPADFERFRRAFFMCDLYPEHESRFPLAYIP